MDDIRVHSTSTIHIGENLLFEFFQVSCDDNGPFYSSRLIDVHICTYTDIHLNAGSSDDSMNEYIRYVDTHRVLCMTKSKVSSQTGARLCHPKKKKIVRQMVLLNLC